MKAIHETPEIPKPKGLTREDVEKAFLLMRDSASSGAVVEFSRSTLRMSEANGALLRRLFVRNRPSDE